MRPGILIIAILLLPTVALGASEKELLDAIQAINLGRNVNLNCDLMSRDQRQRFEWNVTLFNVATGNKLGRDKTRTMLFEARKIARTPAYKKCDKTAARAIRMADQVLKGAKYSHVGVNYRSPDSYHNLIIERLKRIHVGLLIEKKCNHTKRGAELLSGAELAGKFTQQLIGKDIAADAASDAEREMMLFPIRECGGPTRRKVAETADMLNDLLKMVKLDLNGPKQRSKGEPQAAAPDETGAPGYKFPAEDKVQMLVDKRGYASLRLREPFTGGAKQIRRIFATTLRASQNARGRDGSDPVIALVPRFNTRPLGTIFKKPSKGFDAFFDESVAKALERHAVRTRVGSGVLPTMALTETIEHLVNNADA